MCACALGQVRLGVCVSCGKRLFVRRHRVCAVCASDEQAGDTARESLLSFSSISLKSPIFNIFFRF